MFQVVPRKSLDPWGLYCWDLPAAHPWNNAEAAETVLTIDGYHK